MNTIAAPSLYSETASDSGLQKDSAIWFEGGDIIVIAQQTAFRFHQDALSRYSETWAELFQINKPPTFEGKHLVTDGCPIIMIPDSAHDFKNLLRAAYTEKSYISLETLVDFFLLASLVRLAYKYHIDAVLPNALSLLETIFTTDFSTWLAHQGQGTRNITMHPEDAIEALNLFRSVGRLDMLPRRSTAAVVSPCITFSPG